MKLLTLISSI